MASKPEKLDNGMQNTQSGGNDSNAGKTIDGGTISGTLEEIAELRAKEVRKLRIRNMLFGFAGVCFVLAMGTFAYFFLYRPPEKSLGWPMANGRSQVGMILITGVPETGEMDFGLDYPANGKQILGIDMQGVEFDTETETLKVTGESGRFSLQGAIGQAGHVPMYIAIEFRRDEALLNEDRLASFQAWRARKSIGTNDVAWTFDAVGPLEFWSEDSGVPHHDATYIRTENGVELFGVVSYFRRCDMEIVFMREIPDNERWRGEVFLRYGIFLEFSENYVDIQWEGMQQDRKFDGDLRKTFFGIRELLSHDSPKDWQRGEFLLRKLLCQCYLERGVTSGAELYDDAVKMLREFREKQRNWFNAQIVASRRADNFDNQEIIQQIQENCMADFSTEDRRYYLIRNSNWN